LLHYALKLTSDTENARDLVQETFVKALTNRNKFTQYTNFGGWVYTIMKNTFINNYRRDMKKKNTLNLDNKDFYQSQKNIDYQSPESIFNSKEIIECINTLDTEFKIPFNLFLAGFKYMEIAEEIDLPLGTVKSRIFFARQKLGKSLKHFLS
jgi:RNA polymerase sigma factor (sigma-70 family)